MGRGGGVDKAGRGEVAVALGSLPEDERKWLRWMGRGGEEREGRAGLPRVEGVGPGPALGTRNGACGRTPGGTRLPAETGRAGPR